MPSFVLLNQNTTIMLLLLLLHFNVRSFFFLANVLQTLSNQTIHGDR